MHVWPSSSKEGDFLTGQILVAHYDWLVGWKRPLVKEKNINVKSASEGNSNPNFLFAVRRFGLKPCCHLFMAPYSFMLGKELCRKLFDTCDLNKELSLPLYGPVFYFLGAWIFIRFFFLLWKCLSSVRAVAFGVRSAGSW